jgi:hypothetical protein
MPRSVNEPRTIASVRQAQVVIAPGLVSFRAGISVRLARLALLEFLKGACATYNMGGIQAPTSSLISSVGPSARRTALGPSGRSETGAIKTTVVQRRRWTSTMERFALPCRAAR